MKLALNIAEKLLLLFEGQKIASSKMKYSIVQDLIAEGIIYRLGKSKSNLQLVDKQQLELYLYNHFEINNLRNYIVTLKNEESIRADLISAANDSKAKSIRTFKGFLVNSYKPICTKLNGETLIISPSIGTFSFIYDFESFRPDPNVTIVGIENPENFRYIEKQQQLFSNLNPLFVSRYPQNQSKDVIMWLQSIPNNYLHFGDFDLAGIGIYLNEYKKYLADRATFFIPNDIENFIINYGNKKLYDNQIDNFDKGRITEIAINELIGFIHKYKKGLEQEIFISMSKNK